MNDDGSGLVAFRNLMKFLTPPPRGPMNRGAAGGEKRRFEELNAGQRNCLLAFLASL